MSKQELFDAMTGGATADDALWLRDYMRQVAGTVLGNLEVMKDQANTRFDNIERELKLVNRRLRGLEKELAELKSRIDPLPPFN